MRTSLLELLPPELLPPPPPPRVKLRERRHVCEMYVRKVKGELYQLRPWVGGVGNVNCGLYDEATAGRVRRELVRQMCRHPATALGVWRALKIVLRRLARTGADVPVVWPMWVERDGAGRFWGRASRGGVVVEVGPFVGPIAAHRATLLALRSAEGTPAGSGGDRPQARLLAMLAGW